MAEKISPFVALKSAGKLEKDVVAIKVDGQVQDLLTPVEADKELTPIKASEPEGLAVVRHSTAHIMADAVQRLFPGTKVTFGPATEDGFYYDFHKPGAGFTDEDLASIEKEMQRIVKADSPFKREAVTRDAAIELFEGMNESFKVEWIRQLPEGDEITLYRHGAEGQQWVDLCRGPHVPKTGFLKAIKLTHVGGAYWRGDERNPMLQRVYGTSFPSKEALDEHFRLQEEARQRDHRKLAKELDLVIFDDMAPAMPFFLPKGAFVYNRMIDFMRANYVGEGYEEVITPQLFHPELFRTSGHLANYAENVYRVWTEDHLEHVKTERAREAKEAKELDQALGQDSFAVKPMNCPSHCVIFGARRRSYRELPWRVADFGRLHRYERGGVVHGLARVRSFAQDDAHIFCSQQQVPAEIARFMRFFYAVYKAFGFESIDIRLATRPEKRLGTDDLWDTAERGLAEGLESAGLKFDYAAGEGAFYGPKIEFHVKDAIKRSWQLGTMQFDPMLPERFGLRYVGEDGKEHQPIMLHRAVFGSIERFFGVYLEHIGGNFPAWIAPRQAIVLTVSEKSEEYGRRVHREMLDKGLRVDIDDSADKLGAKIRNARMLRYPYLLVIGAKEAETDTLSVRSREKGELGTLPLAQFIEMLIEESKPPSLAPMP